MEKERKNKILVLIVIASILIIIGVLLLIFLGEDKSTYPEEPIVQSSLGEMEGYSIEVEEVEDSQTKEYKLYALSNKTSLEAIETLIADIDRNLKLTDEIEGEHYYWSNDQGEYFQYSLLINTLTFSLSEGIPWTENELTPYSFSTFVKRHLGKQWDYVVTDQLAYGDEGIIYYANRIMPNSIPIETSNLYNETDYLKLKDGRITAGKILLTEFTDMDIFVPIVNSEQLKEYINLDNYPKSIYFNQGEIASTLSLDEEYLNPEILELQEEITECRSVNSKVVYLYTSFSQDILTPVFKLDLECSLEYEGEEYYVSGLAYVNAIDPQYVAIQE
jgi:hypothetical protein